MDGRTVAVNVESQTKSRIFRVQCDGSRHRVAITQRGVRFEDHDDQDEIWGAEERDTALAILAGGEATRPVGCYEIASLVRRHHFVAAGSKGGARELLSRLRGKQVARRLKRNAAGACK